MTALQMGVVEIAVLVVVSMAAFAATGMDSLLVLVPVLVQGPARAFRVAAGYLSAMAGIVLVSWGLSSAGTAVMPFEGGLLGAIPVAMGLAMLSRRWGSSKRSGKAEEGADLPGLGEDVAEAAVPAAAGLESPGGVGMFFLTLSLSADNFASFVPLMADTPPGGDVVVAITLVLAGLGWVGVATYLASRPALRGLAERWGGRVLPLLLIGVGIYVLANTPFDVLP